MTISKFLESYREALASVLPPVKRMAISPTDFVLHRLSLIQVDLMILDVYNILLVQQVELKVSIFLKQLLQINSIFIHKSKFYKALII